MLKNNMKKLALLLLCLLTAAEGAGVPSHAEIDILVAFDQNAAKAIRCSPNECAQRAVNNLQQALVRSNMSDRVHFNLAGVIVLQDYESEVTSLKEEIENEAALSDRKKRDLLDKAEFIGSLRDWQNIITGKIPELAGKREAFHADLVLLAQHYDIRALYGMGHGYNLGEELEWDVSDKTNVIHSPHMQPAVNYVGCFHHVALTTTCDGVDVFVHEMMHLLGCGHSDRQVADAGPGPFYYTNSNGFFTEDFRYGTVMSYPWRNAHKAGSEPHVQGNTRPIVCLSGPYRPYLSGADANQQELPELFGDEEHNNRLVALLNAGLVSTYELSGHEKLLNDDRSNALPLPPMVASAHWLSNYSEASDISTEGLAQILELSIPGFSRPGALTSVIFGTNVAAEQNDAEALPGGSGKTVWYRLTPQASGDLRIGIRKDGTESGLAPVLRLFNADGTPTSSRPPLPQEEAKGYYHCLDAQVSRNRELYIAVDTGNRKGGQFSLVAQLVPDDKQPADEEEAITERGPAPEDAAPEDSAPEGPAPEGPAPEQKGGDATTSTVSTNTTAGSPAKEWDEFDMVLLFIAGVSTGSTFILLTMLLFGKRRPPLNKEPWRPTERKDTKDEPAPPENRPLGSIQLSGKLYNGKSVEYSYPISRMLQAGELKLGHNEKCGICISDETVSGFHAAMSFVPSPDQIGKADLRLKDLGSTNGTWVNGRKLPPGELVKLHHGETIQLGLAVFTLHIQ